MKLLEHRLVIPANEATVTLVPFGCLHADDQGHVKELWEECVERIASTPLCWGIGLGDYKSFARTHYRSHIRAYQADEDSQRDLDNLVKKEVHEFYDTYFKRIRGKLLGLAEGNHHWTFQSGETDTQMLCRLADVPYLEHGSFHRLILTPKTGKTSRILKMLVHHGDWGGSAMTTGGDINSMEKRGEAWNADIFVSAHSHRKHAWTLPVMTLPDKGELKLVERPRVYIRAGCFVGGYVQDCVTYAERKLMRPTSIGYVVLRIELYRKYDPEKYLAKRREGKSPKEAGGSARDILRVRYKVEL